MSRQTIPPTPDVRDQRPPGRPIPTAGHYLDMLQQVRRARDTARHYQALLKQLEMLLHADLEADFGAVTINYGHAPDDEATVEPREPDTVPITTADFLPRGAVSYINDESVF